MQSDNQQLQQIAKLFGIKEKEKSNKWYVRKIKEALESDNND